MDIQLFPDLEDPTQIRILSVNQRPTNIITENKQGPRGPKGEDGDPGIQGPPGDRGEQGETGKSAYQEAVDQGFVGDEEEWIASLKGETGETGPQGIQGIKGDKGDTGDTGSQGIQGPQGNQGEQGDPGNRRMIYQEGHGFDSDNLIYFNVDDNKYYRAIATSEQAAEVVGIVEVIDADRFYLTNFGFVNLINYHDMGVYFLSEANPGEMTLDEPTTIGNVRKPVFISIDNYSGMFVNHIGYVLEINVEPVRFKWKPLQDILEEVYTQDSHDFVALNEYVVPSGLISQVGDKIVFEFMIRPSNGGECKIRLRFGENVVFDTESYHTFSTSSGSGRGRSRFFVRGYMMYVAEHHSKWKIFTEIGPCADQGSVNAKYTIAGEEMHEVDISIDQPFILELLDTNSGGFALTSGYIEFKGGAGH